MRTMDRAKWRSHQETRHRSRGIDGSFLLVDASEVGANVVQAFGIAWGPSLADFYGVETFLEVTLDIGCG